MSRDDERPDPNPGDDDNQEGHSDFNSEKPAEEPPASSAGSDDSDERGVGNDRGNENGGFPKRYQPTSHPEDAPGGFNPNYRAPGGDYGYGSTGSSYSGYQPYSGTGAGSDSGYQSYGQPYSGYGPGNSGYDGGGAGQGREALEKSDGKINIMRAVRFGFKSIFANPGIWILGTVVLGVAFMFLSITLSFMMVAFDSDAVMSGDMLSPVNLIMNIVIAIFSWAVMICVMRGALLEVDGRRARLADFFRPINVGQTLLLLVIIGVVGLVVSGFLQSDTADLIQVNETTTEMTLDEAIMGRLMLYMVISMLVAPLHSYWVYYAADGRENALGAIRHGFVDAARNYFKLLAYSILAGIVAIVGTIITLTLGLVVLLPASILISTHLYRQMSGGKVPVEVRN